MESECERNGVFMFSDEHLGEMSGLKREEIPFRCCVGALAKALEMLQRGLRFLLQVTEISRECTPGCQEG